MKIENSVSIVLPFEHAQLITAVLGSTCHSKQFRKAPHEVRQIFNDSLKVFEDAIKRAERDYR